MPIFYQPPQPPQYTQPPVRTTFGPPPPVPMVVSDAVNAGSITGNVTATWPHGAPAAGSVLIAVAIANSGDTIIPPIGDWVTLSNTALVQYAQTMGLFYKVAVTREAASLLWTTSSSHNLNVTLACVTGASPSEPQISIFGAGTATSITSTGIVPTTIGSLALTAFAAAQNVTAFSVATGWRSLAAGNTGYASTIQCRIALTSDLVTPISTSTTFTGTESNAAAFGIVLAPVATTVFTQSFTGILNLGVFGTHLGAMVYRVALVVSGAFKATISRSLTAIVVPIGSIQKSARRLAAGFLNLFVLGVRPGATNHNVSFSAATRPLGSIFRGITNVAFAAIASLSAVSVITKISRVMVQTLNATTAFVSNKTSSVYRALISRASFLGNSARVTALQTFNALISAAAVLNKLAIKPFAGTITNVGSTVGKAVITVLTGVSSIASNVSKTFGRVYNVGLNVYGMLLGVGRANVRTFGASFAVAGASLRQTRRTFVALNVGYGNVTRAAARALNATMAWATNYATQHGRALNLSATLHPVSQILRSIMRALNAALGLAVTVDFRIAAGHAVVLFLSAATTTVANINQRTIAVLSGIAGPTAVVSRTVKRSLAAFTIALGGAARATVAALTSRTALSAPAILKVIGRSLTSALTLFVAIGKQAQRRLGATSAMSSVLPKAIQRALKAQLNGIVTFSRYAAKLFGASSAVSGSALRHTLSRIVNATATLTGPLTYVRTLTLRSATGALGTAYKSVARIVLGTTKPLSSLVRRFEVALSGLVRQTTTLRRATDVVVSGLTAFVGAVITFGSSAFSVLFSGTSSLAGNRTQTTNRPVDASVAPIASAINHGITRTFQATSAVRGIIAKRLAGLVMSGIVAAIGSIVDYIYPPPRQIRHRTIATPISNRVTISTPIYPGARESRTHLF